MKKIFLSGPYLCIYQRHAVMAGQVSTTATGLALLAQPGEIATQTILLQQ